MRQLLGRKYRDLLAMRAGISISLMELTIRSNHRYVATRISHLIFYRSLTAREALLQSLFHLVYLDLERKATFLYLFLELV